MKRSTIACVCILMSISLTSLWAVWEGNAGIAATSEFPGSGMYARSDMFPKNTIVEILNLEKDITVRVVITGSSNVPGLVAVISPDTASALNIRSGSVARVRISIPSPVTERPAAGTVSTGTGTEIADPDINPSVAAASATTASPLQSAAAPASSPLVPLPLANTAQNQSVYDEPTVQPVAETTNETATTTGEVTSISEVTSASEVTQASDVVTTPTDVVTTSVAETAPTVESVPVVIATTTPDVVTTPTEIEPTSTDVVPVPASEIATETAPIENTTAVVESAPIAAVSEVTPSPEYSVVTLVPAEPKPPVVQDAPLPSNIPLVAPVPVPIERVVEVTPPPVVNTQSIIPLPYINVLLKGSYYIQIASYSDPINAQKVVDTFGKKYPVVIERSGSKSGDILKVLIGPVHKDEYGAVLERFKLLGYKDAFVKKANK